MPHRKRRCLVTWASETHTGQMIASDIMQIAPVFDYDDLAKIENEIFMTNRPSLMDGRGEPKVIAISLLDWEYRE